MKLVISMILVLSFMVSGCVALQADVKPQVAQSEPGTRVIRTPDWPMQTYATADSDAFVVLGVKDPEGFPVPKELVFKSEDGKIVKTLRPIASKPEAQEKAE